MRDDLTKEEQFKTEIVIQYEYIYFNLEILLQLQYFRNRKPLLFMVLNKKRTQYKVRFVLFIIFQFMFPQILMNVSQDHAKTVFLVLTVSIRTNVSANLDTLGRIVE